MNKTKAREHYAYLLLKELTDPKYYHLYEEGKYDPPDGPKDIFKVIHDVYSKQREEAQKQYNRFMDFYIVSKYFINIYTQAGLDHTVALGEMEKRKAEIDPNLFEGKIKLLKRQKLLNYFDELIEKGMFDD